ncbi:MAG: hypothetical protein D6722_01830 [Bacteroidetes bacterium]|nr:MAG: hypothetical protein D6722_01830 [Bacteroidota bacterium]
MEEVVIYKSSAGSGKTFALVLEYLKIVLRTPGAYRHILAVTFTNKATEEMKGRIVQTLDRLSSAPPDELAADPMYRELQAHFATQPEIARAIPQQARRVLDNILNDYANFSVSTIDHFFQRIVRAFAQELQIPLGYGVEMRQDEVLEELVDGLLLELEPGDSGLYQVFMAYLRRQLGDDKGWNVDRALRDLGKEIFKEEFRARQRTHEEKQDPDVPFDRHEVTIALAREIETLIAQTEAKLKQIAREAIALLERHGLTPSSFKGKTRSKARYFEKILAGVYQPTEAQARNIDVEGEWVGKSEKGALREALLSTLYGGIMDAQQQAVALALGPEYRSALILRQTIFSFGLLQDLQARLKIYREENNLLLISDTNELLRPVIETYSDAPFVYEKVGTRYQHYLLDEFQDTSDAQWRNLRPLVMDALSQGLGSLVVGDAKQSIYRWRNGDMKLLLQGVEADVAAFQQRARLKVLEANYRTSADIVGVNNVFFGWAAEYLASMFPEGGGDLIRLAYADVKQKPTKTDIPGWVAIEAFPSKTETEEGLTLSWKDQARRRCLALIQSLRNEGFAGEDICLLVRKNAEGTELAEYLQAAGESVVSADSLLVDNHPRVRFLTALLQALLAENDVVSQAELVYHHARLVREVAPDHTLFSQPEGWEEALAGFAQVRTRLRRLPVYACVERLCQLFPILAEPNAYVQGFLDACLEYATTEDGGLSGFWAWWEEVRGKRAIATTPDPGAVQIITIHKAKGLEFPVVILPYCDWELPPKPNSILWVESEWPVLAPFGFAPVSISSHLEHTHFEPAWRFETLMSYLDNLNLLYVAMTRPQYRLYMLTERPSEKKGKGNAEPKRVAALLEAFYGQQPLPIGTAPEDEPLVFVHGEKVDRARLYQLEGKKPDHERSPLELQTIAQPLLALNEALRIRFSSNQFLATGVLDRQEAIAAGELLHEALAYVGTEADIPAALDRLQMQGTIRAGQRAGLVEQLTRIVRLPAAQAWFSGQWAYRAEAEILTAGGRSLRPDRVMTRGTEAIVVDYKSGSAQAKYHRQVRTYMAALREIGYTEVTGFIYYVQMGEVEEVGG